MIKLRIVQKDLAGIVEIFDAVTGAKLDLPVTRIEFDPIVPGNLTTARFTMHVDYINIPVQGEVPK